MTEKAMTPERVKEIEARWKKSRTRWFLWLEQFQNCGSAGIFWRRRAAENLAKNILSEENPTGKFLLRSWHDIRDLLAALKVKEAECCDLQDEVNSLEEDLANLEASGE